MPLGLGTAEKGHAMAFLSGDVRSGQLEQNYDVEPRSLVGTPSQALGDLPKGKNSSIPLLLLRKSELPSWSTQMLLLDQGACSTDCPIQTMRAYRERAAEKPEAREDQLSAPLSNLSGCPRLEELL
jgi:hypothetical protein